MTLVAWAPLGLMVVGVAKAGALLWAGLELGLPAWMLSIAAALWVTGPATVAWLYAERRRRRAGVPRGSPARG